MIIKSVGVLSVGKVMGCIYAVFGLIAGGLFSLISLAGAAIGGQNQGGPAALFFGVGAIIFFPILYGVMGFIAGIIGSALYNLIASLIGGIEVELSQGRTEYQQE